MSFAAGPALLTDLYELTMVHAYWREGMQGRAAFELFLHDLPQRRNFLIAAGLDQALSYLEGFAFTEDECRWLYDTGRFERGFIDYLEDLRFSGDVFALPEGTVFFEKEPVLRVEAPLPVAQIVETRLINLIQFQTMVASKAVRSVLAAPGKQLVDFGLRRAHGSEAGMLAARASYLAGFSGTSNVAASREYGIPAYGTMAHSYIMAHDSEEQAFDNFARAQPDNVVLLIDTWDTEAGARKAASLATQGVRVNAVRIDSGDLAEVARRVRGILDQSGAGSVRIFASGDLDEYALARIVGAGAPIDGFGIGTRMVVSLDEPFLNCVYKLQEYNGRPCFKRSTGKATLPGRKQVQRHLDGDGRIEYDLLTSVDAGAGLLEPVMLAGRPLCAVTLEASRSRAAAEAGRLTDGLRALDTKAASPVRVAPELERLYEELPGG